MRWSERKKFSITDWEFVEQLVGKDEVIEMDLVCKLKKKIENGKQVTLISPFWDFLPIIE